MKPFSNYWAKFFLLASLFAGGLLQAGDNPRRVIEITNHANDLNSMADNYPSDHYPSAWVIRGLELSGVGIVDLRVKQEEVFSPDARVVINNGERTISPPNTRFLRGNIEGMPGSIVAITLGEDGIQSGLMSDGDRVWELKRRSANSPLETQPVEIKKNFKQQSFSCEQDKLPEIADQPEINDEIISPFLESLSLGEAAALQPGQLYQVTVAIDSDYEFYQKFGSTTAATNYIGSLFNYISGIYEAEIQTRLQLGNIYLWTSSSDPWVETSGTSCRLYEFGRYWRNNRANVTRTTAHFLSGANLGGGVAWLNTLCSSPTTYSQATGCATVGSDLVAGGFGVSANISGTVNTSAGPAWDAVVVAHEIGHNFNSPHTHCYANLGGNSNPVDACYSGESGTGCWVGGTSLPGINTLTGGTSNGRNGTIMSYCHLLSGNMGNIAGTFGLNHPYGISANRVPNRMLSGVAAKATSYPTCIPILGATTLTAPSGLSAAPASATQINLSWVDNSSNETGFYIERKTGSGGTYAQIGSVGAGVKSYASTGLTAGTTYYYRVRAYNGSGNSGYSNEAYATTTTSTSGCSSSTTAISVGTTQSGTLAATDCQSTLRAGRYYDNFTFAATAGTTYTITMTSSFDNYLYLLNSAGAQLAYNDDYSGTNARILYTPTTSGTLTIQATSYGSAATGSYTVALSGGSALPTAPSGLSAAPASATQINLSWVDNSSNETGFYIERKTGSGGTYAQIGSVGAGVKSYASTGLTAGTTYYYRVRAYNGSGNSGYSNEAYATTSTSGCSSSTTAISVGTTQSGTLAATDCQSTLRAGRYYDNFTFAATAGTTYTITMTSSFDNYLYLLNSAGAQLAYNDDYSGTNARILYTPTASGTLTIQATSYGSAATGSYTVTLR